MIVKKINEKNQQDQGSQTKLEHYSGLLEEYHLD